MELKKVSGAAAAALIATSLNMAPVAAITETPQADYKDAPDNDKAAESSAVGTLRRIVPLPLKLPRRRHPLPRLRVLKLPVQLQLKVSILFPTITPSLLLK